MNDKQHWEQVYRQRPHDQVSWYQTEPALSLRLIEACRLAPQDAIIDIGGGASSLTAHLLAKGYRNLSVLDIAAPALQAARQRLGEQAAMVHWLEQDIRRFRAPQAYALWHDRALFHFLTDAGDRQRYIEVLQQSLGEDGHLIIATFAKQGPAQCSGLDIVQYDAASLSRELGEGFILLDEATERHPTPAGGEQAFQYCHFRRAAVTRQGGGHIPGG